MRTKLWYRPVVGALLLLAPSACSTSNEGSRPDEVISIAEQNSRVGEQTFDSRDPNAIEAAVGGACASGCGLVEIRTIPGTQYGAARVAWTAAVRNGARGVQLRDASARIFPLAAGADAAQEAACPSEVVVQRDGLDVFADGKVLRPDPDCVPWGRTVCGDGSAPLAGIEWSELGRRFEEMPLKFRERVCLHLPDTASGASLGQMLAEIADATGRKSQAVLRQSKPQAYLADAQITERVVEAGPALTACYDQEADDRPPMKLTLSLLIQTDGTVAKAHVTESQGTTPSLEACVAEVAEGIRFPEPEGDNVILINYPLSFQRR